MERLDCVRTKTLKLEMLRYASDTPRYFPFFDVMSVGILFLYNCVVVTCVVFVRTYNFTLFVMEVILNDNWSSYIAINKFVALYENCTALFKKYT